MERVKFLEDSIVVDNILVISDIHIGKVDEYGFGINEVLNKLEKNFEKINNKFEKIVILGDFKHDFGKINDQEFNFCLKIIDYLLKKVKKKNLIFIKGNHDNILISILKKRELIINDYYISNKIGFLHGDKEILEVFNKTNTIICGHLHPSITLKDKYKSERYKCYLKGRWKKKNVYILPSFNPSSYGYDLRDIKKDLKDKFVLIPNKKLLSFKVFIYNNSENKIYNFGNLKNLI